MPLRSLRSTLRFSGRSPSYELQLISVLVLLAIAVFMLTRTAQAEVDLDQKKSKSTVVRKRTTTIIEKEEDGDSDDDDRPDRDTDREKDEREIKATFGAKSGTGMAGCKTEDLAKKAVKALKSDCAAWLKDRQAELKSKYVVGTCDEDCDDCGMHLKRCAVEGKVRYR